jgi:hypothetical protein
MNKNQTSNALEVLVDAELSMVTGGASLPTDKGRHVTRRQSPDRKRKDRARYRGDKRRP